ASETIVMADGHHRYETALAYRDEQRGNEASRWVLAYLANMEEEGVVILPTHRLIRGAVPADIETRLAPSFTLGPADGRRGPGEIDCGIPRRKPRLSPRSAAREPHPHRPPLPPRPEV